MKTILQLVGLAIIGVLAMSSDEITQWMFPKKSEADKTSVRYKASDRSNPDAIPGFSELSREEAFQKIGALPWSSMELIGFEGRQQSDPNGKAFLKQLGRTEGRKAMDEVLQYFSTRNPNFKSFPNDYRIAVMMTYVLAGWAESEPDLAAAAYRKFLNSSQSRFALHTNADGKFPPPAPLIAWNDQAIVSGFG